MKKILVPTDFSERAKDAYHYAQAYADALDASLKVVHIYHPSADLANTYSYQNTPELESFKKEELENFVASGFGKTIEDVVIADQVDSEILIGFAKDKLIELSKTDEVDTIIMGTTGKGGVVFEKLFGSVSSNVAQFAHCPVLLIPEGKQFKGIDNILFAGSYDSANDEVLKKIIQYAQLFNANVHLVHVYDEKDHGIDEVVLKNLFQKKAPDLSFQMVSVTENSVEKGLQKYALENGIDMIINVARQRKFWDNLLHRSVTKRLALNAKLPLMVLHV